MLRKNFSPKIFFSCILLLTIVHFIYQNAPQSNAGDQTAHSSSNRSHTIPIGKLREWLSLSKLHGGKHKLVKINQDEQKAPLPTEVSDTQDLDFTNVAVTNVWKDVATEVQGSTISHTHETATAAISIDSAHTTPISETYEYYTSAIGEQIHSSTWTEAQETTTSQSIDITTATSQHTADTTAAVTNIHHNHGDESRLPCSYYQGAEDIVFVIKTGATELAEKIPVHFNTTFRCFPNTILYSDHSEDYQGHTIHDAIGNVMDQIRLDTDDFDLWRRLKSGGRQSLKNEELSTHDEVDPNGGAGNPDNSGWRLDKFKNIPMANYTIHQYPKAKWFIHTDADTYIFWSNLLTWLNKMDSEKLIYLGSPAVIGEQVFGHGGSGYIISNALMWKASQAYNEHQEKWDKYAEGHWAGDCVLATLLEELGGPLTWSFPIIQGGDPMTMDFWQFGYDRRLWCYPVVSYHHIKPSTVASLWHFEQKWTSNSSETIRHSDVFKQWVLPRLTDEREGWDNLVEEDAQQLDVFDAFECREVCTREDSCVQYRYEDGFCRISDKVRVGRSVVGVQSGWMLDKIRSKMDKLDICDEGDWILP